jgi:WD40 repeat protein
MDPSKTTVKATYKRSGKFLALAADLARRRLYAGGTDYGIHSYDLASEKNEKKEPVASLIRHENYVSALALLEREPTPLLVSGSYDRRLLWWNAESGETLREVEAHAGWVRDVVAIRSGGMIASCGDDMLVKLWNGETGQLVRTFEGHARRTPQDHVTALYALAATPDGKFLASGDRIGEVRVWEIETGKLAAAFQVPVLYTYDDRQRKRSIGGIRSLAFSPDGRRLAVGGIGQIGNVDGLAGPATVEIWDWQAPRQLVATGAQGHKALVNQLEFWPDGQWLVGAGGGGDNALLCFWQVDPLPEMPQADATTKTDAGDKEKKEKKDDPLPLHKFKAEGHLHRLVINAAAREIYTAGHEKLEVWSVNSE